MGAPQKLGNAGQGWAGGRGGRILRCVHGPSWWSVLRLRAGAAAGMGSDSLAIGVTAFATLYALLLPTAWVVPLAPVAFVLIVELFERARRPTWWRSDPATGTWVEQPVAGRASARLLYVLWGLAALVIWVTVPRWAALLYVPWLSTVPWLIAYSLLQRRQRRLRPPGRGPGGAAGVREPRRPRPSSGGASAEVAP